MPTFDLPTAPEIPKDKGVTVPNTFSAARLKGGPISVATHDPVTVPSNWSIQPKRDENGKAIEGHIIATCFKDPNLVFEGTPAEFSAILREVGNE